MNYKEFLNQNPMIQFSINNRYGPVTLQMLYDIQSGHTKEFIFPTTIYNKITGEEMQITYRQGVGHIVDKEGKQLSVLPTAYRAALGKDATLKEWIAKYGPHVVKPKHSDILYCLAMDADVENQGSFEEWASNYGYDEDSRKAEKIYRACKEQTDDLKRVLGAELFDKLLECTEDE